MERLSQVPSGLDGAGNPSPSQGTALGHPSVRAADDDVPHCLFPKQGTCPGHSAMGRAPQQDDADSAIGVSGDTRDPLQASEDSWQMGRQHRATREAGRGEKTASQSRVSYVGKGTRGKPLKKAPHKHWTIHAAALDLFPSWR